MIMRESPLAASINCVLICTESGNVEHRFGTDLGVANVLLDPRFEPWRALIAAAAHGGAFSSPVVLEGYETATLNVTPLPILDGPGIAMTISSATAGDGQFQFVAETMRQGLWQLDAHDVVVYANPYLIDWLDALAGDVVGKAASVFRGHEVRGTRATDRRSQAEFVTKTGIARRAVIDSYRLTDGEGNPCGQIQIVTDVMGDLMRTRLMQEVQAMTRLARTDPLTGLSNRLEFDDALEFLQDQANGQPFAMIYADLDNLKEINDRLGHEWGDIALVEVAQHLRSALRDSDVIARLGGDEFGILLPGTSLELGKEIVRRLERNLKFDIEVEDHTHTVTVSMGMAHSDDGRDSVAASADRRMYRQKKRRKQARSA